MTTENQVIITLMILLVLVLFIAFFEDMKDAVKEIRWWIQYWRKNRKRK
jgi:hypothetical protein